MSRIYLALQVFVAFFPKRVLLYLSLFWFFYLLIFLKFLFFININSFILLVFQIHCGFQRWLLNGISQSWVILISISWITTNMIIWRRWSLIYMSNPSLPSIFHLVQDNSLRCTWSTATIHTSPLTLQGIQNWALTIRSDVSLGDSL